MKFENVELPSNRKFGFFFTAVFLVFAGYFTSKESISLQILFLVLALSTGLITLTKPDLLLPFNKLWMRLGFLLGKIVSPIVLGIIFFVLFTPIAIVMRLVGRDELRLKRTNRSSHWKERSPIGPEPSSFKQQF